MNHSHKGLKMADQYTVEQIYNQSFWWRKKGVIGDKHNITVMYFGHANCGDSALGLV